MNPYKIPVIGTKYVNVYRPAEAVYPGPDGRELRHGRRYAEWVPNDHTFISGPDGTWHLFGITPSSDHGGQCS